MSIKKPDSERVRDIAPMGIRLPAYLKQRISDTAKISGNSMNSLVVDCLEEAFPNDLSEERELFLIRAVYLWSQSYSRHPGVYRQNEAARELEKSTKEVLVSYIRLKFPHLDPDNILMFDDPDEFGNLSLSEVYAKQKEIDEFVQSHPL